jgi:4-amino-4-deoxy-L-arabinose transferase-like glycosyltransferase
LNRSRALSFCLLAAIVALAAFLRVYRIDALPPSAGYDQAAYALDALEIVDGARPVFLPSNFGREALFSYLVALVYLVLGDAARAVYVTSALIGVLTIPAVYLAAAELFRPLGSGGDEGILARWGGLLAALVLAISRWHLSWSRLGMRAILVPLFAATTVWMLWRGLRSGRWWAFVGCGLSLGLSLHTYQAARALPLLVLLGYGYVAWSRRSLGWRDLGKLATIAVVTLAVFAPLAVYFVRHPGSAGQRIAQAAAAGSSEGLGETVRILARQTVEAGRALFVRGDSDPRVTVLGRPALNPFLSVALALGIGISCARLRRPAYALLLTWLVGLSAPAILAQYGWVTKRALGATPAVAMLVAVGCLQAWQWARKRRLAPKRIRWASRALGAWAMALLIGGGLIYSGVQTTVGYFRLWAADPDLFTHFEVGASEIGRAIAALPAGERVYLSPVPADHPGVVLYSGRRPGVQGYQGRYCMVAVDRASQDTTYLIAHHDDRQSLPQLAATYPQSQPVSAGVLHYGQPYFSVVRVPAGTASRIVPQHVSNVNWAAPEATIQLWGYDLDRTSCQPGDRVALTLYWRITAAAEALAEDYTVFVQLLGPDNPATGVPIWAQDDSEPCRRGYPTSAWRSDEIVIDPYALAVPEDAPAGAYQIAIGFYEWPAMQRLPVLDAAGQVAGDHVLLTALEVAAGP